VNATILLVITVFLIIEAVRRFHWNDISGSRDDTVFLVTPGSGRMVEIGNVDEGSADNEVLLHIAYKSFHG